MSHFSKIKTKISDKNCLIKTLLALGYCPEEGLAIRGYQGSLTRVDIQIKPDAHGYAIGFRKEGENYVCVADWFGIRGIEQEAFLQKLTQQYAVEATKDRLLAQGFCLAEEKRVDGRIHLVLRRAA